MSDDKYKALEAAVKDLIDVHSEIHELENKQLRAKKALADCVSHYHYSLKIDTYKYNGWELTFSRGSNDFSVSYTIQRPAAVKDLDIDMGFGGDENES